LTHKIRDFFEVFLFFVLTLALYTLFIFTIPIARESHGWIALNGFDNPLWRNGIDTLIFGSALVCALLGALMMSWVPVLSSQVTRNLWVLTYFFIWIDTVFLLSIEYQTIGFLLRLILGMTFIFLFFYILHVLGFQTQVKTMTTDWKFQLIQYWTWGWMSFYFSLSFLLVYNSFKYSDFRLPLAFGALSVCFINYIFSLFMQRSEGGKTERYSKIARIIFISWAIILLVSAGFLW
jgi:hypothetical protein